MNRALRNGLIAVSMGWIGSGMMARAKEAGTEPRFCVLVYNYTSVSAPVLEKAEKTARGIFERAGVETAWMNYDRPSPGGPVKLAGNARCASTIPFVYVNLIDHTKSGIPGEFLGLAPGDFKEDNRQLAYVFDDVANEVAALEGDANKSILVAYAMAHEIGHLMNLDHSVTGIMRGQWREQDFTLMTEDCLNFNPQQAAHIRKEITRRIRDQADSQMAANSH